MNDNGFSGKTYAYIAVALMVACAVCIGLTFTVCGIYALIAAALLSLASLSFVNVQKKKNDFPQLKIIKVCAYCLLFVTLAFFAGGIIWSAVK